METLNNLWTIILDVWQKGFLGINIGKIVVALLILGLFFLLRRLFTRFVIEQIEKITQKTETEIDDRIAEALENPIRFIPIVLGVFFAVEYLALKGSFEIVADKAVRSLIVFVIFWGLANLVEPLSYLLKQLEKIFTAPMVSWLIKSIRAVLIFIGGATILEIWGIKIGPILAGLGLFGVAIALGAQDLFKNLISGILIIAERRFGPGDWIKVDGVVEGTVENIGFRSTLVRRFDKAPVFVPNSKLSDNSVTNFSAMTHRRIYWIIGVEYRTTIDQLRQIRDSIEEYIVTNEDFANPSEASTFVRINQFSDSSIDIMVYCFTKTIIWGKWLEIKESLAYHIKNTVEKSGTGFAFPSQSLYVEELPSEKAEIFTPPEKRVYTEDDRKTAAS